MALNQWFKFYGGEYLSDPKIASLTPQERSCWVTLLCLSSISSTPGTVEYLTVEALLQKSGIVWDPYVPDEWDRATSVLDKFVRMKMITKNEEGLIEVLNWSKRQDTNLTNAERQAKYRETHGKVTQPVTKVTLDKIREDKNTGALEDEQRGEEDTLVPFQEEVVPKLRAKYANARVAFSWLPNPQKSWDKDLTQLSCGNLLFDRGEEQVKKLVRFVKSHQEEEGFNWVFTKPSDYERKWEDMKAYAKRING